MFLSSDNSLQMDNYRSALIKFCKIQRILKHFKCDKKPIYKELQNKLAKMINTMKNGNDF